MPSQIYVSKRIPSYLFRGVAESGSLKRSLLFSLFPFRRLDNCPRTFGAPAFQREKSPARERQEEKEKLSLPGNSLLPFSIRLTRGGEDRRRRRGMIVETKSGPFEARTPVWKMSSGG